MPVTGELSQQNIKDRYYGVNDPVATKLLNKAGEMRTLEPPEDESIKTLYVGGLDGRMSEQDLRDNFYAHGEIESIRMVLQRACAFVTYTTREAAEKAAEDLSNKLVIKGLRLKLMWGRPQQPKLETDGAEQAKQQAAVAHSGMLPRAVISQHQTQLHPPGTQDQIPQQPIPYFNIPPPPQQERAYYPSMDPQRMGALVPSQDVDASGSGENKSGADKTYQGRPPYLYHHHNHQDNIINTCTLSIMATCHRLPCSIHTILPLRTCTNHQCHLHLIQPSSHHSNSNSNNIHSKLGRNSIVSSLDLQEHLSSNL